MGIGALRRLARLGGVTSVGGIPGCLMISTKEARVPSSDIAILTLKPSRSRVVSGVAKSLGLL